MTDSADATKTAETKAAEATVEMSTEELRRRVVHTLTTARDRTALLTYCVDDHDLTAQHSPLMSPLVWDLAHIGNQEEQWLLRTVGRRGAVRPEIDSVYDAFARPRSERPTLPLQPPAEARAYASEVRGRVLDVIEHTPLEGGGRLLDAGFAFGMIAQHEQQHDETMLITHQLRQGPAALTAPRPPAGDMTGLPAEVLIGAGRFTMGTTTEPWALDNERPAHQRVVPAFFIDTTPVTNGAYQRFIEDGGYTDEWWWAPEGWAQIREHSIEAPLFWRREDGHWVRRRFGTVEPVPADEPVLHVSWYEADAYARWAGRRRPPAPTPPRHQHRGPPHHRSTRHHGCGCGCGAGRSSPLIPNSYADAGAAGSRPSSTVPVTAASSSADAAARAAMAAEGAWSIRADRPAPS